MSQSNHSGFSPVYTNGKYANKTCTKYGNYGSDTYNRAKKAARHAGKKYLKNIDISSL